MGKKEAGIVLSGEDVVHTVYVEMKNKHNRKRVSHKRIRRVSLAQFYAITTGKDDAFYSMCMVLPNVIEKVVKQGGTVRIPHDTVLQELKNIADMSGRETEDTVKHRR